MSLIKWRPNMDAIENALSVVKRQDVIEQTSTQLDLRRPAEIIDRVFEVRPRAYGDIGPAIRDQVELPRICASRRMPWMQRYIRVESGWILGPAVPVDPQRQHELYDGRVHDTVQLTSNDTDYETCAWCGVTGKGGIECLNCGTFTCHGTIYRRGPDTWARCVCGRDGVLTMKQTVQTGIFPKVRAR
jgi:hypothetical protein